MIDEGEVVGEAVVESSLASSREGCRRSAIKLRIAPGSAGSQPREGVRVSEGFAYTRGSRCDDGELGRDQGSEEEAYADKDGQRDCWAAAVLGGYARGRMRKRSRAW